LTRVFGDMSKTGVVKFFNNVKGFGFIVQDDGGEDLFVHANNLSDRQQLVEGDAVRYDCGYDEMKGKSNAQNVTGGTGGEDFGEAKEVGRASVGASVEVGDMVVAKEVVEASVEASVEARARAKAKVGQPSTSGDYLLIPQVMA